MKLKKSPFLHITPVDKEFSALYHSLNLEVVFLPNEIVGTLSDHGYIESDDPENEETFQTLYESGFLIEESDDGFSQLRKYVDFLEEPAINILYLLLTDACNIRCKYCYFLAPMTCQYKHSHMSQETAKNALDLFVRSVSKSIAKGHLDQHIILYGGEPTLNKQVVLFTLKYIDELKSKGLLPESLSVTMNTNGTLLDSEILDQCKETGVVVAISIDGPKEVHDQMRIDRSGVGTFDKVMEGYEKAKKHGVKTGVCVTIDKHNIDKMKEIIYWLNNDVGAKGMGFNILIENSSSQTENQKNGYAKIAVHELIESFKVARQLGIYEDRMMRRVKNFVDKEPVFSDCGGCGLQVVVSPDGQAGVCQAFCGTKQFFVQESLQTLVPEEHPLWKQWRKRSPFTNEECHGCIAFGNCGGGCAYNAFVTGGSLKSLDQRFCEHAKTATEFLIIDLWESMKSKVE